MYFSAPLLIFFPHCFKPHSVRFACLCAAHWELPSSFFLCECDEAPLSSGLFRVGDLLVACFSAAIPTGFPTKLLASVSYDGVWGTKSRSAQPGAPTAVHTGMRNARHECFLHPGGLRMPALTGGVWYGVHFDRWCAPGRVSSVGWYLHRLNISIFVEDQLTSAADTHCTWCWVFIISVRHVSVRNFLCGRTPATMYS